MIQIHRQPSSENQLCVLIPVHDYYGGSHEFNPYSGVWLDFGESLSDSPKRVLWSVHPGGGHPTEQRSIHPKWVYALGQPLKASTWKGLEKFLLKFDDPSLRGAVDYAMMAAQQRALGRLKAP